jgi:hypothetical protein
MPHIPEINIGNNKTDAKTVNERITSFKLLETEDICISEIPLIFSP